MPKRPTQILLVENDRDLAKMIGQHLQDVMWAQVTHVTSGADALTEELTTHHDLVLASMSLPDINGLTFLRELRVMNYGPVILMANHPTVDEAIGAMRLKATELLIKPFDLGHASTVVRKAVEQEKKRKREQIRSRRLRKIASSVIRERRDLRRRMDLICRDFVHAYRRLAQKVENIGLLKQEFYE